MSSSDSSSESDMEDIVNAACNNFLYDTAGESNPIGEIAAISSTIQQTPCTENGSSQLPRSSSSGSKKAAKSGKFMLSSSLTCDMPKVDIKTLCSNASFENSELKILLSYPKCDSFPQILFMSRVTNNSVDDILSKSALLQPGLAKIHALPSELSQRQIKKQRRVQRSMSKGKGWYDMPATELTEDKKNDLMVLQMRKVLDPKRFYKGSDIRGSLPKYFQTGTVVESSADFYSSRIPRKKRKQTLVDELLADAEFRRYNKKKYQEVVATQQTTRRSKAHRHMKRQKKNKK